LRCWSSVQAAISMTAGQTRMHSPSCSDSPVWNFLLLMQPCTMSSKGGAGSTVLTFIGVQWLLAKPLWWSSRPWTGELCNLCCQLYALRFIYTHELTFNMDSEI
jgi:hypothetical protein